MRAILSEAAWLCGCLDSTRRLRGDSNETCLCHWCCSGPGKWRNSDATFRTDIEAQRSKSCWGPELLFGSRMLPAWLCSIWATKICDVMIYELLDSWRFLDATEKLLDLLNMGCLIFLWLIHQRKSVGNHAPGKSKGKETLGNRFGHMILKKIKRSRWAVANGKRVSYVSFEHLKWIHRCWDSFNLFKREPCSSLTLPIFFIRFQSGAGTASGCP